jgi:hypothetical protein
VAYLDLLPRRRVVLRGARRFVCHPPTYATIVRLLALYPATLERAAQIAKEADGRLSPAHYLPLFVVDAENAAAVLETCCELVGGAPGEFEEAVATDDGLALELGRAVLSICDPGRIAEALDLGAIERAADPRPEGEPDAIETTCVILAERFGVSPLEVLEWPFEAYLSVLDTVAHIESERTARMKGGGSGRGMRGIPITAVEPPGGSTRKVRPRVVRRG